MSRRARKIPISLPWVIAPRPTGIAVRKCFARQLELRSGQHDCDRDMPGKVLCSWKIKVSSHSPTPNPKLVASLYHSTLVHQAWL